MLRVGEFADDELDGAVAPRDDDAAARRDQRLQVLVGIEVDDQVIGKCLP